MREAIRGHPAKLFALAVLFTVILLGIDFAVTVLLTSRGEQQRLIYSDVISLFVDFLATGVLVIVAKQSVNHSKRLAIAWGMIALSTFVYALGDTAWAILELILQDEPFPSIADVFYLAYYPLLFIGVLLLPDKSITRGEQVNKVLDVS